MLRRVLLFSTAVLLALTAGRAFWVWLGESPFGMAGPTYDFFQHLDTRIALPIAVTGILGTVLAGACAVVYRFDRRLFHLFVAAFVFGAVGALVTVLVNVPINQQIAAWDPQALPLGYEDILRNWWNWHIGRLITSVGAMCSVFAALIVRGEKSALPAA